ncbi:MAG: nucleotidyl transferase AbiEii/AbiGii toxin family protein [Streptosporangiales bacterium]|nr:nucleotidyl transferase AbiEii/AbiGii toxin family protein [Streptosporangiales bacterium]
MNERPTRASVAGRVYLDLQNLARLVVSPHAKRLVLKGGMLPAAYDTRRPTRDVDLQAQGLANDLDEVLAVVREVAAITLDDGLTFDADTATAEAIREEHTYGGVRVTLTGRLASARLTYHVDVNGGDPIWPAAQRIILPRLIGGQVELTGYPLPMVYAEKIVTAVQRGTANTRWRDFADLYLLAGRHDVRGQDLRSAIVKVAAYRQVTAPRTRAGTPEPFADLLDRVITFVDPSSPTPPPRRSGTPQPSGGVTITGRESAVPNRQFLDAAEPAGA